MTTEQKYSVKNVQRVVVLQNATQLEVVEYLESVNLPGMYSVHNEKTGQKYTGSSFLSIAKTKVL